MVVLAASAIFLATWGNTLPSFYPHGLFVVRGAFGAFVFPALVIAAIALRRRPEWHKRFMLCVAFVVVVPGLERAMPLLLFGAAWPYVVDAVIDMIALAGPVYDLATRGRVHPAYGWGINSIVIGQASVDALAPLATMMLHAVGAR